MPWGAPLSLIGDSAEQVADAQRMLVRIGIDELHGAANGSAQGLSAGTPTTSYPRYTFAELPKVFVAADSATDDDPVLLDVRRDDERAASYLAGSVHLPMHHLLDNLDTPSAGQLWAHCASGYRASIAASLLDRAAVMSCSSTTPSTTPPSLACPSRPDGRRRTRSGSKDSSGRQVPSNTVDDIGEGR